MGACVRVSAGAGAPRAGEEDERVRLVLLGRGHLRHGGAGGARLLGCRREKAAANK
jgi:hypothetical protein